LQARDNPKQTLNQVSTAWTLAIRACAGIAFGQESDINRQNEGTLLNEWAGATISESEHQTRDFLAGQALPV
jgi:hypothetical protein